MTPGLLLVIILSAAVVFAVSVAVFSIQVHKRKAGFKERAFMWRAEQLGCEPPSQEFARAVNNILRGWKDPGLNDADFHRLLGTVGRMKEYRNRHQSHLVNDNISRILSENPPESQKFRDIMIHLGAWTYPDEFTWVHGYFGFDAESGLWKNAFELTDEIQAYRQKLFTEYREQL